ncbi:hypothetical protein [Sphingobium sp. YR657]|uniref:hypothetical protein n=1 Tax=Sphingobium sp. YR657 TaxID=1884366 RepID=UPI0015877E6E|nr:hypothetical protein [Sphingobium sp. YR657]
MIFSTRQGMPAAQRAFNDHYAGQSFLSEIEVAADPVAVRGKPSMYGMQKRIPANLI